MISMAAHISFHGNIFHKQPYNFTTAQTKGEAGEARLLEQALIKVKIKKRGKGGTWKEVG